MSYCAECGTEIVESSKFCPDCGANIQGDIENNDTSQFDEEPTTATTSEDAVEESGLDTKRAIVSGIMGVIVGAVVAFAFTNIGGGSFLFLITTLGVGYYLYKRQKTVRNATGMGLYITALLMPLSPIIFYIPLAGGAESGTAAGAGQAIGSIFGMFIYGFIGLILGLVLAVIGYFARKGGK